MKKLFGFDSPFFQFMEKVANFFIVNALVMLCSLPVITMGAAVTAGFKVMQNMTMENDQPIVKSFFRAFIGNFKQASLLWLVVVLVLVFLIADLLLVFFNLTGSIALIIYLLLAVSSVIALGTATFAFHLIARYENTFKEHLRNAFFLALGNLPRTVIMLMVLAIPVAFLIINPTFFFNTLIFWSFIGVSILFYAVTLLIRPIFRKLEADPEEESEEEDTKS